MRLLFAIAGISLSAALIPGLQAAHAGEGAVVVNIDNFARAETDMQIQRMLKAAKSLNEWSHNLLPTPLDKQNVIRMNRDTLYSSALIDISEGATFTIPDVGDRYLSVMIAQLEAARRRLFRRCTCMA